ncbi:hypothetical protein SARC_04043 [Sphaeroforma arctica JP610]|uniref:Uncharacterized protein n=1 Tax=Sphaeroforma arctica JP610 TaxID=667725 RepID=A0A0L0G675_9EUKA|nr:hypothetical protein SARC_04043 [Sphaeroforma arctica JP610]KNC83713.1 hypothetical protein SARC_04043 [Sphaeroforma arctica JP610]|eukprot:XP_014157615.1 hypothetical protein SARC_04043 [Sphaeroforma arctica JP610]
MVGTTPIASFPDTTPDNVPTIRKITLANTNSTNVPDSPTLIIPGKPLTTTTSSFTHVIDSLTFIIPGEQLTTITSTDHPTYLAGELQTTLPPANHTLPIPGEYPPLITQQPSNDTTTDTIHTSIHRFASNHFFPHQTAPINMVLQHPHAHPHFSNGRPQLSRTWLTENYKVTLQNIPLRVRQKVSYYRVETIAEVSMNPLYPIRCV